MGWSPSLLTPKQSLLWEKYHLSLDPGLPDTESPLLQEGNFKTLTMKNSHQGSQSFTRDILLPFLTNVDTTDKLALALVATLPANTQNKSDIVLINPWISNQNYPIYILCLKVLCLWTANMWFQLLTCTFRRVEQYIPPFECLYQVWIWDPRAWRRLRRKFSMFVNWHDW